MTSLKGRWRYRMLRIAATTLRMFMQMLGGSHKHQTWKLYRCEVQMNHAAALLFCYHRVVEPVVCEPFVALDARVP
jgi:hypothetical protein